MTDAAKPYRVISHDGWGNTCVGAFASLESARGLFEALCSDRWFRSDGSVRGLSLESDSGTLDTFAFSNPDRPAAPRR
jgi:hypothetical protein